LIEVASLSILKTPLTFMWLFLKYIGQFLSKFTIISWNKFKDANTTEIIHLEEINFQLRENNKQKRLGEISARLIEIQKEQHALLEEASELIHYGKSEERREISRLYSVKNDLGITDE
jgi:hypothetical protein